MINQLFRGPNSKQSNDDEIKNKLKEECVLRDLMIAREKSEEKHDNIFNDIYAQKKQLQIAAQPQREQEIERQALKEKFAKTLEEQDRAIVLQQSLQKQIRNCSEIKELERQLLAARVARDQAIQRTQAIAIADMRRQEEKEFSKKIANEIKNEDIILKENERKKKAAQKEYLKALDEQIDVHIAINESHERELYKERELVDKMIENIIQEDMNNKRNEIEKKIRYRKQLEHYRKVKTELNKLESQRIDADEVKAENFRLIQEHRHRDWKKQRHDELESRSQIQRILVNNLERDSEKKACEENLRTELAIQEKEIESKDKEKFKIERQTRLKAENQEIYLRQMRLRQQQKELERKEDELFIKSMLENLYQEDKLETLSDIKRREKQREHRTIILDMIKERRKRAIAKKQEEAEFYLNQKRIEDEKQRLIANEHRKILLEQAGELVHFLPKDVLKEYDKVEKLEQDFRHLNTEGSTKSINNRS